MSFFMFAGPSVYTYGPVGFAVSPCSINVTELCMKVEDARVRRRDCGTR